MKKKIGILTYGEEECPKCKSKNLYYDSYEPIDESFKQSIECKSCDFSFEIWADKPKYWEVYA